MDTSGILVIDKEKGYTSFDVVARLRGILGIRKIGHTGTLDPDATGVLVCCIGKATRLISLMESADKTYRASMRLGLVTDTQDVWGEVLEESSYDDITPEEISSVLESKIGDQMQIPPMYSAKKVGGKKLYELARAGKEIERKPVSVCVHSISEIDIRIPDISFTVSVSKGTYIRTLIHDMGQDLGCGGAMSELRRLSAGKYDIGQAHTLGQIEDLVKSGNLGEILIPPDDVFEDYTRLRVNITALKLLQNGNPLWADDFEEEHSPSANEKVLVYTPEGRFAGVYNWTGDMYKVVKMFL